MARHRSRPLPGSLGNNHWLLPSDYAAYHEMAPPRVLAAICEEWRQAGSFTTKFINGWRYRGVTDPHLAYAWKETIARIKKIWNSSEDVHLPPGHTDS